STCLHYITPVRLFVRPGHLPGEIGYRWTKRELGAVGVLKPELVVTDNPGAVQHAAEHPRVRSEGSVNVDDRRGAVGLYIGDDQRRTSVGVPGRVAPGAEEGPIRFGNGRRVCDPIADALLAKNPPGLRLGHRRGRPAHSPPAGAPP